MPIALSLPGLALIAQRQEELTYALAGLKATGIPLVAKYGSTLYGAGFADNPGLYYYVPKIALATAIPLESATRLFLGGILLLGTLAGVIGWCFYTRSGRMRVLGTAAMLLVAAIAFWVGDLYVFLTAVPLGTIPPLLALWRRRVSPVWWMVALAFVGAVLGFVGPIRGEAGFPVAIFAVALTVGRKQVSLARRAGEIALLCVAFAAPMLLFRTVLERRDHYLLRTVPGYTVQDRVHPFWHQIYIGLGYLTNDRGIAYTDESGKDRATQLAPGTPQYSAQYESVLRREVLRIAVHSPLFVAQTVAAKLGVLALYLLLFGNLGLLAAIRFRKPAVIDLAFAAALAVAALPGVMIVPWTTYLEGFISLAVLFALVSVDWAAAVHQGIEPEGRRLNAGPERKWAALG